MRKKMTDEVYEWDDENKECSNTKLLLRIYRLVAIDVERNTRLITRNMAHGNTQNTNVTAESLIEEFKKQDDYDILNSDIFKKDLDKLAKAQLFLECVDYYLTLIKDCYGYGEIYYYSLYFKYIKQKKTSIKECRESTSKALGYESTICLRTYGRYLDEGINILDDLLWREPTDVSTFLKEFVSVNGPRFLNNVIYSRNL